MIDWVRTDRVAFGCPESGCPHADCGGRQWCDDERHCQRCAEWSPDDLSAAVDGTAPAACALR